MWAARPHCGKGLRPLHPELKTRKRRDFRHLFARFACEHGKTPARELDINVSIVLGLTVKPWDFSTTLRSKGQYKKCHVERS